MVGYLYPGCCQDHLGPCGDEKGVLLVPFTNKPAPRPHSIDNTGHAAIFFFLLTFLNVRIFLGSTLGQSYPKFLL